MMFLSTVFAFATLSVAAPAPDAAAQDASCTSYTIIDTRGTGEAQGPSVAFRTMNSKVTSTLPGGKIYNTVYPAGWDQNSQSGTQDIINHIRQTLANNPSECFILEGYSQGAAATVDAMNQLSSGSEFKAIRGVFLVGDPRHKAGLSCNVDINDGDSTKNVDGVEAGDPTIPSAYVSKTMDVCNYADGVCDTTHGSGIGSQHLAYGSNAGLQDAGAKFVIKQLS